MIKEAIATLIDGKSLNTETAAQVMEEIMDGKSTPAQLGSFLTALRIKGETSEEIAGFARVMQSKAIQVKVNGPCLDIVGTGGDGLNAINVSTGAAFVAAGAGIKIAKHGNRAASSLCGSADVLESLGIKIDLTAEQVEKCIKDVGIGFMFAQVFHPAMKYAGPSRKEIGIRTVFNILGPLTNPAHAESQVIGVPNIDMAEKIVSTLVRLNTKHALVVHGLNGMDELSIAGDSLIWEVKQGILISSKFKISPLDFGLKIASQDEIRGGKAEENANILKQVLSGTTGPRRDVIVLNAGAAMVAADITGTLKEGIKIAQQTIDSGLALEKVNQLVSYTRAFKDIQAK
jgi:anthranilate phosphoribosyltransferase